MADSTRQPAPSANSVAAPKVGIEFRPRPGQPTYFCVDEPTELPKTPDSTESNLRLDCTNSPLVRQTRKPGSLGIAYDISRSQGGVVCKSQFSESLRTPSASNSQRRNTDFTSPSFNSTPSSKGSTSSPTEPCPSSIKASFALRSANSSDLESTLPRSAKRIIRPDNSWQKNIPKATIHTNQLSAGDSLIPGPLRIRRPTPETPKKQQENLHSLESFSTTKAPVSLSHYPSTERQELVVDKPTEKSPPITRENILRHILSEGDFKATLLALVDEQTAVEDNSTPQIRDITMSLLRPESAAAMSEHRREAVRLAKAQERSVVEKCKRSDQESPGYTFEELIGKGSYGRVYKGRQIATSRVVAIKVIDVDEADFHAFGEAKDEQIRDFNREIRILRQAQESGAPNMNQMIEALPVHSQLWMVCEYCPGGSVKTLMRATNDRLSEKYIVVVGRELAKALKGLHDAGIMHRDVKAANVLIHEEGRLQLCDFGVAGVLEQSTDKRRTFIGTLHWMPPELWSDEPEYSDEVDVWEYGITLYECALGKPPNSDLRERQQLKSRMRRLKQAIGLPEHENFSEGLRSLVKFALSPEAKTRPSMKDVLEHEYLRETEETHPTSSLIHLVQVYYQWLYSGGQRASLFMPGGAVVTDVDESIPPSDEWNFSTTEIFDKRVSALLETPDFSELSPTGTAEGEATPKGAQLFTLASPPLREMTNVQQANFEARVKRGADLSNLFDQEQPNYEYKIKKDFVPMLEGHRRISDLPLRAMSEDRPTSIASNVIDLGDFDESDYAAAAPKKEEKIQLADAATIRAKRGDSKGPRDGSATTNLTMRRTSSAEDVPHRLSGAAVQDFAFPPKEWGEHSYEFGQHNHVGSADSMSLTEKVGSKETARQTMDWTFATAMPSEPEVEETESPRVAITQPKADRIMKHATLDWSFDSAMAAASESEAESQDETPRSTKVTPARPAPPLRMMTQPVTRSEVHHADESPRPSTTESEARSESSLSSADFDPFSLDSSQDESTGILDPSAFDDMGVSSFYASRGRTLVPTDNVNMSMNLSSIPYTSTVAGPTPYMLGRPARIGEDGFPGPAMGALPNLNRSSNATMTPMSKRDGKKKKSSSSSSSAGRPKLEMIDPVPPSEASLRGDAGAEVVENELQRLLGGLQQGLAGAGQAMAMMRRGGKRSSRGKKENGPGIGTGNVVANGLKDGRPHGRPSSSEWEDEE